MIDPENIIALHEHRRGRRVLQFFADLLGGGTLDDVAGLTTPLPTVKHLPRLAMDIAVTRDPAPAYMKAILQFARRRQVGFILVRFRDPAPEIAEALLDVVFFDTGVAVLDGLSAATADGRTWWLAGRHTGDVHLRVENDGLIPTLTEPWEREDDRHSFVSQADQILSEYIWRA